MIKYHKNTLIDNMENKWSPMTFTILDQVENRNFSFSLFSFGERGDSVGGDTVAPTTHFVGFSLFIISSTLWILK